MGIHKRTSPKSISNYKQNKMRQVKIYIVVEQTHMTKLLSHAEYQTFKQLSKGQDFEIKPKGHDGVEVTAPISLWEELGY